MSGGIIKKNAFVIRFIHVKLRKLNSHIEKSHLQKDCDGNTEEIHF